MNSALKVLTALALAVAGLLAHGQSTGPDRRLPQMILDELEVTDAGLASCQFKNGTRIEADQCTRWRDKLAKVRAEIAAADRQREIDQREAAEQRRANAKARADQAEQRQRAVEAARAEDDERKARQAEKEEAWRKEIAAKNAADEERRNAEKARREAETAAEDAAAAKAEAALRKLCGKDYMAPRIGMPIKRALQCLGGFELVRQVNRKDGVLSTYVSTDGQAWLHELGGRVVAWGQD